jgi:hypothetical protein
MVRQLLSTGQAPGRTFASTGFGTFASGALRAAFGARVPGRSPADLQRLDPERLELCYNGCLLEWARWLGVPGIDGCQDGAWCECEGLNVYRSCLERCDGMNRPLEKCSFLST